MRGQTPLVGFVPWLEDLTGPSSVYGFEVANDSAKVARSDADDYDIRVSDLAKSFTSF
jgi:hypothetical protein